MLTPQTRKERFELLRLHLDTWQKMLKKVHLLSPCDPLKKEHKRHACIWSKIISEDPDLLEMVQEVREFEDIFLEYASEI
jgi:hypothetical protein